MADPIVLDDALIAALGHTPTEDEKASLQSVAQRLLTDNLYKSLAVNQPQAFAQAVVQEFNKAEESVPAPPGGSPEAATSPPPGSIVDPGLQQPPAAVSGIPGLSAADAALVNALPPEVRAAYLAQLGGGDTAAPSDKTYSLNIGGASVDISPEQHDEIERQINKGFKMKAGEVRALQRNLIAAGYLPKDAVKVMGWYDGNTALAYRYLLGDAYARKQDPVDTLRRRLIMNGQLPEDQEQLLRDELQSKRDALRAYKETWGHPAPEGWYEANAVGLNPSEVKFLERQKESWLESGVAQETVADFEQQFSTWINGKRKVAGVQPGRVYGVTYGG